MISPEFFMGLAIKKARQGTLQGQAPFGACIVKGESVVACCHNQVWTDTDITAHAEVVAIREACEKLKTVNLSGCVIYATCEPCPMCFTAIHWAKISKIYFGTHVVDAQKLGFSELPISNKSLKKLGRSEVELVEEFLREEALDLFLEWSQRGDRRVY